MDYKRRKLSKKERKQIHGSLGGHCAYCGCDLTIKDMQVDHKQPLRKGGSDTIENMLPACRPCNHRKSTLDIEQFREDVLNFPNVLQRDNVTYRNAVRFEVVVPNLHKVKFYFEREGLEE
ncbi:MAG: HNH endonuclease [Turicibacter sp.]|nr:HNH endonuclease [Turicibacter sp.]